MANITHEIDITRKGHPEKVTLFLSENDRRNLLSLLEMEISSEYHLEARWETEVMDSSEKYAIRKKRPVEVACTMVTIDPNITVFSGRAGKLNYHVKTDSLGKMLGAVGTS